MTTITNSGTITATHAVSYHYGVGNIVLYNSGTLNGGVLFDSNPGNELHNTGAIHGDVDFAGVSGTELFDGRGGTVSGTVSFDGSGSGGSEIAFLGNDGETVHASSANLTAVGGTGNDTISGGTGNDRIDGGGGNDSLDGGGGLNTVSFASAAVGVTVTLGSPGSAQATGVGSVTLSNFQNLTGSLHADHLTGDGNNNVLDGGGGDDTLDGGGGVDTISFASAATGVTFSLGSQGSAQATGAGSITASNFQNLTGSSHADHLTGDANDNTIDGGGGDDVLDGAAGTNTLSFASAAAGVMFSLGLQGSAQATGAGSITASNFQNLTGSAFNDILEGDANNNVLDGGGGTNTISYAHAGSGVTLSLAQQGSAQNTVGAGTDTLFNFQNLTGSLHADHLAGDANGNIIDGGGGDDVLDGGAGTNTLSFASAANGISFSLGSQGSPQATGVGSVTASNFQNLTGSAFNDILEGDANNNVLDGGGGINTLTYAHSSAGVTVSLALPGHAQSTGGAGIDTLYNFQNLIGSAFGDTLEGDGANNVLDGGAGTNTVSYANAASGVVVSLSLQGQAQNTIGSGSDTLSNFQNLTGSAFNDTLEGDSNNNVLTGGGGTNTVSYAHAASGVTVSLALLDQAQNTDGAGIDTLSNFQNLTGSAFNDTLEGDGNNNVLDGGAGTNTVSYAHAGAAVTVSLALQGQAQNTGGAGTDTLSNFQTLIGSAFNDSLTAAASGASTLTGGAGSDTFVVPSGSNNVTITDFSDAQGDKVDLSHLGLFFSLNDVLADASQVGPDTVIAFGLGSIRLQGVSLSSLAASDFTLGAGPPVGPGVGGSPYSNSILGRISAGPGPNWLLGGSGNDTLWGNDGSDYLDGGGGLNTALYNGVYLQYTVSPTGTAVSGGPEGGTDFLANIQRIQFVDGYLATSPTDYAGQVYRVYEATLGRAPDPEGLATWVHALSSGTSLQTVVDGFVGSQEFQSDYGNLSNSDFATLLYNNVLHRPPDDAGLAGWVSALNSGADTRAQVVLDFSESQEDIGDSTAAVQKGLWIGDTGAGEAARLYDTVFGRLPDEPGLATWTQSLDGGTSLQTAAADFVASAEFQSKYGALNDNDFVALLYNNVLHRAPDTAGLNSWLATLASGTARAQVVLDFSESQEHIADTAPHIDYGVWVAS
ncbi:MAG TPA: DUF4214 domain-containing protein [Caulobacteraceae bacterium]